jgi:tetratricopeptide (TPR) repeat protein
MTTPECETAAAHDWIERYLAKRLTGAEQEAFESHYLTCERCQERLTLGMAVRAHLLNPGTRRRPRYLALGGLVGLAAAAAFAILVLRPGVQASDQLRQLGMVRQAPIYLGVPVRAGNITPADSLFEAAMTEYLGEHYDRAAGALDRAVSAGVDPVPAEFFRAASRLMLGQAKEAEAGFARTVALGDTPYRGEAHFYRAKALLQLGRASDASAELVEAIKSGGVIGNYARTLADSLQEIQKRSR